MLSVERKIIEARIFQLILLRRDKRKRGKKKKSLFSFTLNKDVENFPRWPKCSLRIGAILRIGSDDTLNSTSYSMENRKISGKTVHRNALICFHRYIFTVIAELIIDFSQFMFSLALAVFHSTPKRRKPMARRVQITFDDLIESNEQIAIE